MTGKYDSSLIERKQRLSVFALKFVFVIDHIFIISLRSVLVARYNGMTKI